MGERAAELRTFSTRSAARILAVSPDRIRYWVKQRLVKPSTIAGGRYQFAFNDLLVMRLAKELLPLRRHLEPVRRCFERLGRMLDPKRPVTSLKFHAEDGRIVVRDGRVKFEADSGQMILDFDLERLARELGDTIPRGKVRGMLKRAQELEHGDPVRAIRLYATVLQSEPKNFELRMRLGGLLERCGDLSGALHQYLEAVTIAPDKAEAHRALGHLYRRRGKLELAARSFLHALDCDPESPDLHRQLAELYEKLGRKRDALRHLSALHRLTRD